MSVQHVLNFSCVLCVLSEINSFCFRWFSFAKLLSFVSDVFHLVSETFQFNMCVSDVFHLVSDVFLMCFISFQLSCVSDVFHLVSVKLCF